MRPPLPRVALFALLLVLPSTSRADDYLDFRIPDYRLSSWNLSASGRLSASRDGSSGSGERHTTYGSYSISSPLLFQDVTDRRERSALVALQTAPYMYRQKYSSPLFSNTEVDFRTIGRNYLGQAGWFESRYNGSGGFSWNWGSSLSASWDDRDDADAFRTSTSTRESASSTQQRQTDYQYNASASLGFGLGRVRDVSGVYEAQVLESRLLETGRLLRPLTPSERQRLAELFYLSDGMSSVHDRPSKYLWTEIERVLAAEGALQDGTLDAWSALRALEPVMLLAGSNRRAGRFVGPFGFVAAARGHSDTDLREESATTQNGVITFYSDFQSSSRTPVKSDDAGVGLDWAEHHPVSMRTQLDVESRLVWSSHRTLTALVFGGAKYLLADRWEAELTGAYNVQGWDSSGQRSEPRWTVGLASTLAYLLEDSWSLEATYELGQSQYRDRDLPSNFSSSHFLTLGVTYRALGRFSAPLAGLASRPMVGGR